MRRSFAPSQVKQRSSLGISSRTGAKSTSKSSNDGGDEVTIQRLPLFGFLSIPNDLKKQFKIPSGCVISEESIALRRRKTLGQRRMPLVVPGGYVAPLPRPNAEVLVGSEEEEENSSKDSDFPPHEPVVLWRDPDDDTNVVQVIPQLASRLRPHQREGVQFLFECTMGLRGFEGEGCILADDMGLGKTLMSLTLLWTLLNQGMTKGKSAVQKAIVVCPTSLVGNWENEFRRWIGDHCPVFAVKSDPQKMIKNFIGHRNKGILIISYETQRRYCNMFTANNGKGLGGYTSCCELLICDEAHKLKNADSGLSKSLNLLPAKKRILLSGTPMQNELTEFFNMVNFCNPNVLGNLAHFRKKYENPILRAREPDASPRHIEKAEVLQKELSTTVNEFILKRGNILNAQHLPPKLVQFVCCKLTPLQEQLYECVLNSKESRHLRDGKQTNTLNSLRHMLSICSHPDLILSSYRQKHAADNSSAEDEVLEELNALMLDYNANCGSKSALKVTTPAAPAAVGRADRAAMRKIKMSNGFGSTSSSRSGFNPERSGKFLVLSRLMTTLRNTNRDRIVVVSNSTQTLDLVESMCNDNNWPQMRLDGSIAAQKRTKLVDVFNDPMSNSFAFLLSSKAGGCGINLIGGNRLVMMDPDWNPASDKQAAARIWREGQQKRCYIYRLMSTCTIEEKIIQRQLSKEGLQSIVDNTDQVNSFSSSELKSLFQRDNVLDTRSNTHDTLRCKRCKCVTQITTSAHKNGNNALLPQHIDTCVIHLEQILKNIEHLVSVNMAAKMETLGDAENTGDDIGVIGGQRADVQFTIDIKRLKLELELADMSLIPYQTVPEVSKRIRTIMMGVDQDLKDQFGVQNVTLFNDFIASWTELVPVLQNISKQHQRDMKGATLNKKSKAIMDVIDKENAANGSGVCGRKGERNDNPEEERGGDDDDGDEDEDEDGDEYVEQEGCPEEEDFNRWSHHSSVRTCYGDESLQKAMSIGDNDDHGDNTISFVFGLEVNWDLLQERMAKHAVRDEQRRLQVEADLLELNREREEARERARQRLSEREEEEERGDGVGFDVKKRDGKKKKRIAPSGNNESELADGTLLYIDNNTSDDESASIEYAFSETNEDHKEEEKKKKKREKKKKKTDREKKYQVRECNYDSGNDDSGFEDCFLDQHAPKIRKCDAAGSEQNKRTKVVVIDDSDSDDGHMDMENVHDDVHSDVDDLGFGGGGVLQRRADGKHRPAVCIDSDEEEEKEEIANGSDITVAHRQQMRVGRVVQESGDGQTGGESAEDSTLMDVVSPVSIEVVAQELRASAAATPLEVMEGTISSRSRSKSSSSSSSKSLSKNKSPGGRVGERKEGGLGLAAGATGAAVVPSWTCVSCTFLNMYPARLCDVCGCRKPRTGSSFSQESQSSSEPSGRQSGGACGKSKGRLALPTKKKGVIHRRNT